MEFFNVKNTMDAKCSLRINVSGDVAGKTDADSSRFSSNLGVLRVFPGG